MQLPKQLAKHLREVYTGGNWSWANLKDITEGVSWQQATTTVYNCNSIATLVYHINYYVHNVAVYLESGTLNSKDKDSFNNPPIESQTDWETMLKNTFADGEKFANLIEQIPEDKMWEIFKEDKYGIYFRNINGIIEHFHYHLGQIALIKKIIGQQVES